MCLQALFLYSLESLDCLQLISNTVTMYYYTWLTMEKVLQVPKLSAAEQIL